MELQAELAEKKGRIAASLDSFFARKRKEWSVINRWGPDLLDRLLAYTKQGKMLRGALVLWTASLYGKEHDALEAAAALELLQSALLIHDDVMDEDDLRRGKPTMHMQYEALGMREGIARADHYGVSMAVCAGDAALFLAYELLSHVRMKSHERLSRSFSEMVAIVGLGQMQDVHFGASAQVPSQEDILSMYEHKTATYTFSLPLLLGAIIGGAQEEDLAAFDELGKVLGKIFQLKDDELGLFSTADSLGKSVGIDIVAGKKTVLYALLLESATPAERERLRMLQSSQALDECSLSFVRGLLEKYSLRAAVHERVASLALEARRLIANLPLPASGKVFFERLLAFNLSRSR